jgi:MFS family permease
LHRGESVKIALLAHEKRSVAVLASVFSLRLLGLFMLLPVLALYAERLDGATPTLIGIAVGAYGMTQAALQIPFGWLSDRIGRRPVILFGLSVFIVGSIVAAYADTIWGVVGGRALQGAGAISAALTAMLADRTRTDVRTRAMAFLGMSIGMSFMLSLVLGPVLNVWIGVAGMFWLSALLGVAAILMMLGLRERAPGEAAPVARAPGGFAIVLRDPALLRLYVGVLGLHLTITALFVAVPFALRDFAGLAEARHWVVYLLVIIISLVGTVALILTAERWRHGDRTLPIAIGLLSLALFGLGGLHASLWQIVALMVAYFAAFTFLEARLPAVLSQTAPEEHRGAAMGVFASAQFFGAFLGGGFAGSIMGWAGIGAVFAGAGAVALLWLLVALIPSRGTRDVSLPAG